MGSFAGATVLPLDPPDYNRDIRPLFSENCFYCHGQDANHHKAGLRLDVREAATTPAESDVVAIVPGKPQESALVARIFPTDRDEQTPPPKSNRTLTEQQKQLLRRWVEVGAKYDPNWSFTPPRYGRGRRSVIFILHFHQEPQPCSAKFARQIFLMSAAPACALRAAFELNPYPQHPALLPMDRRDFLLTSLVTAVAAQSRVVAQVSPAGAKLRHSVCRGPFSKIPMDEFCEACKGMGIESIELLEPVDYPAVQRKGLQCAVGRFTTKRLPDSHINCGWNRPEFHPVLLEGYTELIQKTADAGFKKVICFSGLRQGMDEKTGLENCAAGLSKLMPLCDKLGVTMVMELLNSKVNHADYMADNSPFGVALCEKIGHPRFRLLYDIYHMQIMEGNLCATIKAYHQWFAHYHTAGVPGRHEIDDTQEIHYPAVVRAILETGYRDFLGQEFSPAREDKLGSLKQAIEICTPPVA